MDCPPGWQLRLQCLGTSVRYDESTLNGHVHRYDDQEVEHQDMDPPEGPGAPPAGHLGGPWGEAARGTQQQSESQEVFGSGPAYYGE